MKNTIIAFLICGLGLIALGINSMGNSYKHLYCGVVKYKVDATKYGKYKAYADPILVVNFPAQNDEEAFIYEVHHNWNTYLSHKEGDKVCFELIHPDRPDVVGGVLLVFLGVMFLIIAAVFKWVK